MSSGHVLSRKCCSVLGAACPLQKNVRKMLLRVLQKSSWSYALASLGFALSTSEYMVILCQQQHTFTKCPSLKFTAPQVPAL